MIVLIYYIWTPFKFWSMLLALHYSNCKQKGVEVAVSSLDSYLMAATWAHSAERLNLPQNLLLMWNGTSRVGTPVFFSVHLVLIPTGVSRCAGLQEVRYPPRKSKGNLNSNARTKRMSVQSHWNLWVWVSEKSDQ